MSRTRAADRIGFPNAITVKCECGKRLALLDITGAGRIDGIYMVPTRRGEPVVADDWNRLACPVCSRTWEGRNSEIIRQLAEAKARGATSMTLAPSSRGSAR